MKNILKLFISIYLVLILFILTSFSGLKKDPISEIFKTCESIPVSSGIKLIFKCEVLNSGDFLKSFGIDNEKGFNIEIIKDYISFESIFAKGYLEYIKEEDSYILYYESKDKQDNPKVLRDKFIKIKSYSKDLKYYVFQKGRVSDANGISEILDKIHDLNGKNISQMYISNGWNVVFKMDDSPYEGFILDNGKLINYQCALMKYKNGNYLIIGSPLICITY